MVVWFRISNRIPKILNEFRKLSFCFEILTNEYFRISWTLFDYILLNYRVVFRMCALKMAHNCWPCFQKFYQTSFIFRIHQCSYNVTIESWYRPQMLMYHTHAHLSLRVPSSYIQVHDFWTIYTKEYGGWCIPFCCQKQGHMYIYVEIIVLYVYIGKYLLQTCVLNAH